MARAGSTADFGRRGAPVEWTTNNGRNDYDDPLDVPDTMSVESLNITLRRGNLGSKRAGSARVTFTGAAFNGAAHLARYLRGEDLTQLELFIVDTNGRMLLVGGTTNAAVELTKVDPFFGGLDLGLFIRVTTAMLNGKLYIAYHSPVNRLHVFDPTTSPSTTTVRPVGLPIPGPPTVADIGVGTYPAVKRHYRAAWRVKDGTRILRQSELGATVTFTPSGTGLAAHITKPASPAASEGVTHWVVYGSPDDEVYYELAELPITTPTVDDTQLVSLYNQQPAAPIDGSFFPFPSVRFIASDGVRLFGFGQFDATIAPGDTVVVKPGTAYWTPALGSSQIGSTVGVGDDERFQATVDQTDALPLSVTAGGVDRGITGPYYNAMYFFQDRGIYKLIPTDNAKAPFRRVTVTRYHGSVSQWAQVIGEDESGNECIYFLDPHDGPRRIVVGDGVEWLGKDVSALWATVNKSALEQCAHGVYDRQGKQVKWWVAVGNESFPTTTMIVYHVTFGYAVRQDDAIRGGFVKWTGTLATALTSLMFPISITGPRPIAECPYTGNLTGIFRQDGSLKTDQGTPYQGVITSKAWAWGVLVRRKRILDAFVTANAAAPGTTIEHAIIKDFGTETIPQEVSIEPPIDTRASMVRAHVQGCDIADGICDQVSLGDRTAVNNTWSLNRWDAIVEGEDTR